MDEDDIFNLFDPDPVQGIDVFITFGESTTKLQLNMNQKTKFIQQSILKHLGLGQKTYFQIQDSRSGTIIKMNQLSKLANQRLYTLEIISNKQQKPTLTKLNTQKNQKPKVQKTQKVEEYKDDKEDSDDDLFSDDSPEKAQNIPKQFFKKTKSQTKSTTTIKQNFKKKSIQEVYRQTQVKIKQNYEFDDFFDDQNELKTNQTINKIVKIDNKEEEDDDDDLFSSDEEEIDNQDQENFGQQKHDFTKYFQGMETSIEELIDPIMTSEVNQCLKVLRNEGISIMKLRENNSPIIRFFTIDPDNNLCYFSPDFPLKETKFALKNLKKIETGQQKEELFKNEELFGKLDHLSFTLFFEKESFNKKDIQISFCAKNERQFDMIICVLKGVSYHLQQKRISRKNLMFHCKLFYLASYLNKKFVGDYTFLKEIYNNSKKPSLKSVFFRDYYFQEQKQLFDKSDELKENLFQYTRNIDLIITGNKNDVTKKSLIYGDSDSDLSEDAQNTKLEDKAWYLQALMRLNQSCLQRQDEVREELFKHFYNKKPSKNKIRKIEFIQKPTKTAKLLKKYFQQISTQLWLLEIDILNLKDMIKSIENFQNRYSSDKDKDYNIEEQNIFDKIGNQFTSLFNN